MAIVEAEVQQQVRLAASDLGLVMWRNNTGKYYGYSLVQKAIKALVAGSIVKALSILKGARPVDCGLCKGSSDLIGYTPVEITQEMVGMRLPVFTAIEVKRKDKKATEAQAAFLERLSNRNGIAIVADDWRDLRQRLQASARYPLGDSK